MAGLFAAAFVLAMQDPVGNYNYTHYILSAESDTMIVALCLLAVDLHLCRPPQGGVLDLVARRARAGPRCGRSTGWPACGSGGRHRATAGGCTASVRAAAVPVVRDSRAAPRRAFSTAGNVAENSPREIHGNKITGMIDRFHELLPNTGLARGGARPWRGRPGAGGSRSWCSPAGAVLWVLIEIAFALHGFPAVPRYMFEAGAVVGILAAIFIGADRP